MPHEESKAEMKTESLRAVAIAGFKIANDWKAGGFDLISDKTQRRSPFLTHQTHSYLYVEDWYF
jgi:hypothetical protein